MGKNRCGDDDDDDDDEDLLLFLPEDVLIEILVRLPVASLLRFKCVCKSWVALIQSSFFIDLHTTTSTATPFFNSTSSSSSSSSSSKQQQQQQLGGDSCSFILQEEPEDDDSMVSEIHMLLSEYESGSGSRSEYGGGGGGGDWYWEDIDGSYLHKKLYKLELPLSLHKFRSLGEVMIVGSCNGLICLMCLDDLQLRRFPKKTDLQRRVVVSLWLWNPATRQFRILPPKPITIQEESQEEEEEEELGRGTGNFVNDFVAFGFDGKTKDYKVMLITYFKPKWFRGPFGKQQPERINICRVQVYSLSTDSWRLLEDITSWPGIPPLGPLYHGGIYLNGSYFFVGRKFSIGSVSYKNSLIISFDFTKEIFTTMQLPLDHDFTTMQFPLDHDDDKVLQTRWYLSCLGDKLALFGIQDYMKYENCNIWVLNEHGVGAGCGSMIKESWTKLHFFQTKRSGESEWTMPRGILNNGEFALLETRNTDEMKTKMQLYNLVTKEAKTDFLVCCQVKTFEVYKPSLVSIIGGNGAAAATGVIGGAI